MITSRKALGEYCLRQLGAPVIQINVAGEQINDRLNDGIQKFNEFHGSGSERRFVAFTLNERMLSDRFIEVDEGVLSVLRILPLNSLYSVGVNIQMQATMTEILDLIRQPVNGLSSYVINMQYISMLTDMFNSSKPTRYNRYTNRIEIDTSWSANLKEGDVVIAEVYMAVDPGEFIQAFNDPWLKAYCTALIKKQWGQNMLKYQGFQLPSGVVLDGRAIYEDAIRDIERLEEELYNTYSLPADFFVG